MALEAPAAWPAQASEEAVEVPVEVPVEAPVEPAEPVLASAALELESELATADEADKAPPEEPPIQMARSGILQFALEPLHLSKRYSGPERCKDRRWRPTGMGTHFDYLRHVVERTPCRIEPCRRKPCGWRCARAVSERVSTILQSQIPYTWHCSEKCRADFRESRTHCQECGSGW